MGLSLIHIYAAQFKLSVIKFRKEHGNRTASRILDVAESKVRELRKIKSIFKPVSYTHLDVYKRQFYDEIFKVTFRILRLAISYSL